MAGHVICTENWDGTDRVYISELAPVRELKFSHGLPGGALAASWSLYTTPNFQHRGLRPFRKVIIFDGGGARVWVGSLARPARSNPWQCLADGLGALALRYRAFPFPTTNNYWDLSNVVGQAVARGLPWVLPASLPVGSGTNTVGSSTNLPDLSVAEALNAVTAQNTQTWWVDSNQNLVLGFPLTQASYLFYPSDPGGGRTISEDAVSGYLTTFIDSATGKANIHWHPDAARVPLVGHIEQSLDLTDHGAMSMTIATAITGAYMALHPARVPFANQFVLTRGQILSMGGVEVAPSSVLPPAAGRLVVVDPDHESELDPTQPTHIWVAQTEYDDDLDALTVTPWDTSGDGLRNWMIQQGKRAWGARRKRAGSG